MSPAKCPDEVISGLGKLKVHYRKKYIKRTEGSGAVLLADERNKFCWRNPQMKGHLEMPTDMQQEKNQ